MSLDKFHEVFRNFPVLAGQSLPYLVCDLFRHVTGPACGGVEGDDPDRIAELAVNQVGDYCFAVGTGCYDNRRARACYEAAD
jgi:hypothetical protein